MTGSKHLGSFKEKSLGLTDSNAKISPLYELKTNILKKKKSYSSCTYSTYSFINFAYKSYLPSNGKTRSTTAGSWDISMEVKLTEIQIHWAGHVWKMDNSRVAKQLMA